MNQYVTNLSKHCYYGNITNILNYYGILISESELVILSDALNCSCTYDNYYLFFGIQNDNCSNGLHKLNCKIENVPHKDAIILSSYQNILRQGYPILLLINSGKLNHSYIYEGTNEKHYIVMLNENNGKLLNISDSFVQTIPQTVFQDYIDPNSIYEEIESGNVQSAFLKYNNTREDFHNEVKNALFQYLDQNISLNKISALALLKYYAEIATNNVSIFLNRKMLSAMSYDINVGGCVARCDYLIELFGKYLQIEDEIKQDVIELKSKWKMVVSKLMKCSITLREEYYINIFSLDIPSMIEKEINIYKKVKMMIGE